MKKLLLLLLIIPLLSTSQSNDFLTKLFLDSVQIKNQDFKLELSGVINTRAQKIHIQYSDYYDRYESGSGNLTEILFLKDLRVAQQFKSEVIIGSRTEDNREEFNERCTWNWSGNNPNLKMVSPYSLDFFPTFSFLKGKLLTIIDGDSTNKDYLFSVSKSTKYDNYGHKTMSFNLTDDNEQGYKIYTIIINEQSYIILTKDEMYNLGFSTEFVDGSRFKAICGGRDNTYYLNENSYNDRYLQNCICKCDKDYLSLYRRKTKYMNDTYNLDQDDLLYLFKLVEQN